jgi:hypothetical protein
LRFVVAVAARERRPRPVSDTFDDLGYSAAERRRVWQTVELEGLMRGHPIPTGKQGRPLLYGDILQRCREALARYGLGDKPPALCKGGFVHELCARSLQQIHGKKASFENDLGSVGVRLDGKVVNGDGSVTWYQFGMHSAEREAASAIEALRVPLVADHRLVLVVRDRAFEAELIAALKKRDPSGAWAKVIQIQLAGELILEAMKR